MKILFFVLLPAFIQLLIGVAIIYSPKPGGEFVGLGIMLMGMLAIPLTAIINWSRARSQPSLFKLINGTFYTTLVFPLACLALYMLAS